MEARADRTEPGGNRSDVAIAVAGAAQCGEFRLFLSGSSEFDGRLENRRIVRDDRLVDPSRHRLPAGAGTAPLSACYFTLPDMAGPANAPGECDNPGLFRRSRSQWHWI